MCTIHFQIIKFQIIILICQSPTSQYKTPVTRFHNPLRQNRYSFGVSYSTKENKMKLNGDRKVKILDKMLDMSSNEFEDSEECLCSCNNCVKPKECCKEMCIACPGPNDHRKLRPYNKPSGLNHLNIKQGIFPSMFPFGLNFPSWTNPSFLRQNNVTSSTAAPYIRFASQTAETTTIETSTETTKETTETTTETTTTETTTTTTTTTTNPTTSTKPPITKPGVRNGYLFIPGIKDKYMFGIEDVFPHAHKHMNNYARILSTTIKRSRKGKSLSKDIFLSDDVIVL